MLARGRRILIILMAAMITGCATVPAYNGENQAEIDRIKKNNKRWYWITIAAIAVLPYTIDSSSSKHHNCRPHEDCYDPIN